MTFKLVTKVTIRAHPENSRSVEHEVATKERTLRPGDVIKTTGSVATDVEGKSFWNTAYVEIRVIDNDHINIAWNRPWYHKWPVRDEGYWETVTVHGENLLAALNDGYHTIDEYKYPEAFNLFERLRIPMLIKEKLNGVEGLKEVKKETELKYEPTLPSQSRR